MRKTLTLVIAAIFMMGMPLTASAVDLGYGLKFGYGPAYYPDNTTGRPDQGSVWAAAAVLDLSLPVVGVEANLMWTRHSASDADDTMYYDYLGVVALAKAGLALVPTILDLDLGLGLDYRMVMNTGGLPDTSGTILMLPIALQLTGDFKVFKIQGEARFNYGLNRSIDDDRMADIADSKTIHELLFFLGLVF